MKLDQNITNALLAQAADKATPYRTLASGIALAVATLANHSKAATGERQSVWAAFRSALGTANDAGHTATDLRVGLTIALSDAEVPAGTIRSYLGTVANMYADVQAGTLSMTEASEMTVKDARERYPADAEAAKLKDARKRLSDAAKHCTVSELDELAAEIADRFRDRHEKAEAEAAAKQAKKAA